MQQFEFSNPSNPHPSPLPPELAQSEAKGEGPGVRDPMSLRTRQPAAGGRSLPGEAISRLLRKVRSQRHPQGMLLVIALLTCIAAALTATIALAQQGTTDSITDDQVNAVARQLYCPVCENIPLDVCPTQACAQWRALIKEKLAAGWSDQQIKDYFVQQYGARVLGAPPARGLNWLVYVIPPAAILAGVYILFRAMRAWRQPVSTAVPAVPTTAAVPDEYIQRLEEELKKK